MDKIKELLEKHKDKIAIEIDNTIYVKNATEQGYLIAEAYDGIDLSYIAQNKRRGRVQKKISQTITCNGNLGVFVYD